MTATEPAELLPTRRSLLSRLKNWDNHDSWREFFNTYWRLIYDVARKAGLDDAEAQDTVQETLISVAKEMPGFRYDPERGSFKGWLLLVTRRRIADQLRKRYRAGEGKKLNPDDTAVAAEIAAQADESVPALDAVWEGEWKTHLLQAALARVKREVKPEHFQMFELHALKGFAASAVAKALGVSTVNVYVTRHRIAGLIRKEVKRLEKQMV